MHPVVFLLDTILGILNVIIILEIIIFLLLRVNVLSHKNEMVQKITQGISQLLEPLLKPIKRFIPDVGGIDISPLILIVLLSFTRYTLHYYFA
ncbi:MAG: YggT family protein [Rickettsiaceae bacterium H1]|nr:YggT family protein [Rickettsiaceae bacterium H1]